MIRGAVILAVGFTLGYAKAAHDSDDIRALLAQTVDLLQEQKRRASTQDPETHEGESNEQR